MMTHRKRNDAHVMEVTMMTPDTIRTAIHTAFTAMYPNNTIEVIGAGEETIHIDVWEDETCQDAICWECETVSDDDGMFYFVLADTTVTVAIPYPEA